MQDIKQREQKMQEIAKNMIWRDFLKNIVSWYGLRFGKINGMTTNILGNRFKIVDWKEYEKQRDGFTDLGIDFEFSFFESVYKLLQKIGLPNLDFQLKNINAVYSDCIWNSKNIYLSYFSGENISDILYSFHVKINSSNILNSVMVWENNNNVYFGSGIINSYKIYYSKYIKNCSDIRFSSNLIGCHECIGCNGLENKSYCIQNKQYDKETYLQMKKKILSQKGKFLERYKKIPNKGKNINSRNINNCNFVTNSENITNALRVFNTKIGKNLIHFGGSESGEKIYNIAFGGTPGCDNLYQGLSIGGCHNVYNSWRTYLSSNCYYCINCENCSYCLGCIGLKNKQFCILNKQYSKEERFEKVNKIFEQMEKDGQLGKFFPANMNPFYFNDTVAYLIDDSFTKEEVTKEGFLRREEEIKVDIPEGVEIVKTTELNKYQRYNEKGERRIDPEIMKKVIIDEKGNAYRIVKMEYEFLMKQGLPLPQIHWLERIKLGLKFK